MKNMQIKAGVWLTARIVLALVNACGPARKAAWETRPAPALTAPAAPTPDTEEPTLAAKAEEAWRGREDRTQLEAAIRLWNQALQTRPHDHTILTKLSAAYFFLADAFLREEIDPSPMELALENGILAAENAMLSVSPEFAERMRQKDAKIELAISAIPPAGQLAVYWYVVNLGQFAMIKGLPVQLFYKDRLFAVMQWVLSIDEKVYYGAPHRFLGAFRARAPKFAGGDLNKSKRHFDRALELFPDFFGTKVLYAEYYATAAADRELFVRLLSDVMAGDPNRIPAIVAEQKLEQKKAKRLLDQVDHFF